MSQESVPVTGRERRDDDLRGLEPHLSVTFQDVEDNEVLINAAGRGSAGSDIDLITETAIAAVTGRGLPLINHLAVLPTPSLVTDYGDGLEEIHWIESTSTYHSQPITYDGSRAKLANQLAKIICDLPYHADGFVPRRQLRQIMDDVAVEREMERIEASFLRHVTLCTCISIFKRRLTSNEKLTQIICGSCSRTSTLMGRLEPRSRSYRRVFATLLFIKRPGNIRKFIEEEVCDADLPLTPLMRGREVVSLCRKGAPEKGLTSVRGWRSSTLKDFARSQWKTLAPFFSRGKGSQVENYILDDMTILPFITRDRVHRGGRGTVYKVGIHPEHHNFDHFKYEGDFFAVKELHGREENHRGEAGMLRKFGGSHPHIIPLLATYEHCNCFSLIFPWAKCDLLSYWKTENKSPERSLKTILWMTRQCQGIASGLENVHRSMDPTNASRVATETYSTLAVSSTASQSVYSIYGRHGDIKPANLLWFPNLSDPDDMGTIKISDFGIGEFSTTESQLSSSGSVSYSAPYRPPECDLPDFAPTSSYDVWTLGCLFLEFVTWYIGGWNLLQELAEHRKKITSNSDHRHTFFEVLEQKGASDRTEVAMVKPEIHHELRNKSECSQLLADFLDLVQNEMLIVEPRHGVAGQRRSECNAIYSQLERMIQRCEHEEEYGMKPSSWGVNGTSRRLIHGPLPDRYSSRTVLE